MLDQGRERVRGTSLGLFTLNELRPHSGPHALRQRVEVGHERLYRGLQVQNRQAITRSHARSLLSAAALGTVQHNVDCVVNLHWLLLLSPGLNFPDPVFRGRSTRIPFRVLLHGQRLLGGGVPVLQLLHGSPALVAFKHLGPETLLCLPGFELHHTPIAVHVAATQHLFLNEVLLVEVKGENFNVEFTVIDDPEFSGVRLLPGQQGPEVQGGWVKPHLQRVACSSAYKADDLRAVAHLEGQLLQVGFFAVLDRAEGHGHVLALARHERALVRLALEVSPVLGGLHRLLEGPRRRHLLWVVELHEEDSLRAAPHLPEVELLKMGHYARDDNVRLQGHVNFRAIPDAERHDPFQGTGFACPGLERQGHVSCAELRLPRKALDRVGLHDYPRAQGPLLHVHRYGVPTEVLQTEALHALGPLNDVAEVDAIFGDDLRRSFGRLHLGWPRLPAPLERLGVLHGALGRTRDGQIPFRGEHALPTECERIILVLEDGVAEAHSVSL